MRELVVLFETEMEQLGEHERHRQLSLELCDTFKIEIRDTLKKFKVLDENMSKLVFTCFTIIP